MGTKTSIALAALSLFLTDRIRPGFGVLVLASTTALGLCLVLFLICYGRDRMLDRAHDADPDAWTGRVTTHLSRRRAYDFARRRGIRLTRSPGQGIRRIHEPQCRGDHHDGSRVGGGSLQHPMAGTWHNSTTTSAAEQSSRDLPAGSLGNAPTISACCAAVNVSAGCTVFAATCSCCIAFR